MTGPPARLAEQWRAGARPSGRPLPPPCTTASTVCLIAPTTDHRLEFRQQDKYRIVHTGNRIVVLGLLLLAVAMTGAVLFVTDFLYGPTTTIVAAGGVGVAFLLLWYAIRFGGWGRATSAPRRAQ